MECVRIIVNPPDKMESFVACRSPLCLTDMPGLEVTTMIFSSPQEGCQSEDGQAERRVDGLESHRKGKPVSQVAVNHRYFRDLAAHQEKPGQGRCNHSSCAPGAGHFRGQKRAATHDGRHDKTRHGVVAERCAS